MTTACLGEAARSAQARAKAATEYAKTPATINGVETIRQTADVYALFPADGESATYAEIQAKSPHGYSVCDEIAELLVKNLIWLTGWGKFQRGERPSDIRFAGEAKRVLDILPEDGSPIAFREIEYEALARDRATLVSSGLTELLENGEVWLTADGEWARTEVDEERMNASYDEDVAHYKARGYSKATAREIATRRAKRVL